MNRCFNGFSWKPLAALCAIGLTVAGLGLEQPEPGAVVPRPLHLEECIHLALLNNRDLQVERLTPEISRSLLDASYGYYDPLLVSDLRQETDQDTGGFDPANFSADAVYQAESTIASSALTGVLPTGLSYSFNGTYAHATGDRNSLDFDSHKMNVGVTLRQPLLKNAWIDAGRYTIKISRQNVKFSELGLRFIAMDVVNRVEQGFYELAYAQEAREIQEQLVQVRRELLHAVRRKQANGLAAVPEEQLAQAQLAFAQTALNASRSAALLAENALRTHLGDGFTSQLQTNWVVATRVPLTPEEFDLGASWRRGVEDRPDLAQFRLEVEKADLTVRYRRNQLFPSLDLLAGYGRRGASSDQDVAPFQPRASLSDAVGQITRGDAPHDLFGIVFSIPLSRQAERAGFKASRQLKAQSELLLKQKEELVLREISDFFHKARTALDRAGSAREAVEHSRRVLTAEERRLAGGTSSLFFVLQLQDALASAQLVEARARIDYNQALAQWRLAEGATLRHHRLVVDVH